jgi:Putative MetA-pathway of phenol degradation
MFRSKIFQWTARFSLLCLLSGGGPVLAQDYGPALGEYAGFDVSIGAEYTSGKYGGTTSTDIWYIPLTLRYVTESWYARLTIPYLIVEGSRDLVISGGGAKGGRKSGAISTIRASRTDSGIGDVIAAAGYRLLEQTDMRPAIDLTGKVYFGTADENKGLGTGENDYAAQIDLTKDLGNWILSGAAGYLVTGNPRGTDFKDVVYGRVDAGIRFDRLTLGAAVDAQQATISGNDNPAYLTGYLTGRVGERGKLTGYLLRGLSDASPDWGAGVTLIRQF